MTVKNLLFPIIVAESSKKVCHFLFLYIGKLICFMDKIVNWGNCEIHLFPDKNRHGPCYVQEEVNKKVGLLDTSRKTV